MRKPDREGSSPSLSPSESQGALNGAQELFERMAGDAARLSEIEREEAKSRGPVARILLALTIAACLLAVVTMIYGIYNFPDAPIRRTAEGYQGKGGRARTQADYEAFVVWGKAMLVVFPSAFVFAFAFAIADAMRRRRR